MSLTEKLKGAINGVLEFINGGDVEGTADPEGVFGTLGRDLDVEYPTDRNAALKPAFETSTTLRNERNLKVVSMNKSAGYDVVVFEPRAFNESVTIVEALKERKTVILNLQLLDRDQSQRIVDFLCGCTHALDGNQRKIGDFVFIFTPNNINLSQEMLATKMNKDALWSNPLGL